MTETSHSAIFQAMLDTIVAEVPGLAYSKKIMAPDEAPNTLLDRLYSIEFQTSNPDDTRESRNTRERLITTCTLRLAHRINPHNQKQTQLEALDDEDGVIKALKNSPIQPLHICRIRHAGTDRSVVNREWHFANIRFDLVFEMSL